MKKLTAKLRKQKKPAETPGRITNETVAEHREQILAGGRKFKYPVQYAKHKLVFNSILIALIAVLALGVGCWYLLYVAQYNSKFMYRLTQLIPIPVAVVDGQNVRYSEYLKKYRSDIFSLVKQEQINLKSTDGKRQSEYYKRSELDSVIKEAYVAKLAKDKNISVTSAEVNDFITNSVNSKSISLDAYEKTVLRDFYDWSLDEYKGVVRARLLTKKVSFAIDDEARSKADAVQKRAAAGEDFAALARATSDDQATKASGGDAGSLPVDSQDPNGLILAAQKLKEGQVSSVLLGTDGYFVIKLLKKSDGSVQYSMIKINLTELDRRYEQVKKSGKVKEYIQVQQAANRR